MRQHRVHRPDRNRTTVQQAELLRNIVFGAEAATGAARHDDGADPGGRRGHRLLPKTGSKASSRGLAGQDLHLPGTLAVPQALRVQDGPADAEAGGLPETIGDAMDRAHLAGEADLTEEHRVLGGRLPAVARDDRREQPEIGGGLGDAQPAPHRDVDIGAAETAAERGLEDREQDRKPPAVEADGDAPGVGERALREQRLDLGEQRPVPLEGADHGGARSARSRTEKQPRGVRDRRQSLAGHLEDAQLAGGPEAVLDRPKQPMRLAAVPLEVEHGVNEVLEGARTGDRAFLVHMADQKDRAPAGLGVDHERGGRLADLRHGPGRSADLGGVNALDRVEDQQTGAKPPGGLEDARDRGLAVEDQVVRVEPQPVAPELELLLGLLAADIENRMPGLRAARTRRSFGGGRSELEQEGALAGARLPGDEHRRAGNDPAPENPVEFSDPERTSRRRRGVHLVPAHRLRRPPGAGEVTPAAFRRRRGRSRLLDERSAASAGRAVPHPAGLILTAIRTDEPHRNAGGGGARHAVRTRRLPRRR